MAERNDTIQHRSGCLSVMGFLRRTGADFPQLRRGGICRNRKADYSQDYDKGEIIFHEGDNFRICDRARRIDQDL